ncbi:MAG: hypothetical protein ACI3V4_03480 [Faecousia sp.]
MDLQNTLSTITDYLGGNLGQIVAAAASYLPANWEQAVKHASSYLPTEIDLVNAAQFMLFFAAGVLILSVLSRVVLGKRSSLNHSLSSAIGILFIYAVTIVVYTFKPWNLELLLSPLPFVSFFGEFLVIFPIADAQFPALCSQLLSLVILAFLVNLIDTFLPKGDNPITWFVLRLLTVVVSIILNLAARWAFQTYLPGVLVTYAPSILLVLLVVLMLSGVLNLILGLVISMTNPFLGAMYTFFFSNIVGKQLSKAVFSSAILCAIVYLLEHFGYTVICITAAALMAYIPLVIILLVLWYLVGHVL